MSVKASFLAYVVDKVNGQVRGEVQTLPADRLPPGEVTIAVAYSSLNYKDALAATGQGNIVRQYPHVPGIDAAGTVVESQVPAFAPGDPVLVTGYDLGVGVYGGYAEYIRVPAAWVVKLPAALTPFEAMALGTAGFTAALCLLAMERNGSKPDQGPFLVTGATGGVGSIAVSILAQQGYTVAASTGKADQHDYLRQLGASQILSREEVTLRDERPRPLLKGTWAGAVDTVGGATLSYLIRTTQYGGNIALCGLVGGHDFAGTVIPFLLRGINLLGIDSVMCPMPYRQAVWQRLATDLKPRHLDQIARVITLAELPGAIADILQGKVRGRLLVAPRA
ncbi:MAG: oxidoreductase [Candidatus Tectimicrobiota bacterium]|nr:MAG: oxidoreductase [Candidatus Tectomicrobia bacterium]